MGTPKNSMLHLIIAINPVLLIFYIINARHQVQLICFSAGGLTFCFAIDHADMVIDCLLTRVKGAVKLR
jgi:hypothetical protein